MKRTTIIFVLGISFYFTMFSAYQDMIGIQEYLRKVQINWVNTSPIMWIIISIFIIALFMYNSITINKHLTNNQLQGKGIWFDDIVGASDNNIFRYNFRKHIDVIMIPINRKTFFYERKKDGGLKSVFLKYHDHEETFYPFTTNVVYDGENYLIGYLPITRKDLNDFHLAFPELKNNVQINDEIYFNTLISYFNMENI